MSLGRAYFLLKKKEPDMTTEDNSEEFLFSKLNGKPKKCYQYSSKDELRVWYLPDPYAPYNIDECYVCDGCRPPSVHYDPRFTFEEMKLSVEEKQKLIQRKKRNNQQKN